MLLQPEKGGGRKSLNDTHCWASSLKGQNARYYLGENTRINGQTIQDGNNLDKYPNGQQSSDVQFGGELLIAYATFLGLFVAMQEVLNFAPDGHRCSKWIVKDRFCINGFQLCVQRSCKKFCCRDQSIKESKCLTMLTLFLGEVLYYFSFVQGYNVILAMFLSPGDDLTGYEDDMIKDSSYTGAGLWVATSGAGIETILLVVVWSFVVVVASNLLATCMECCEKRIHRSKLDLDQHEKDDFEKPWWDFDNEEEKTKDEIGIRVRSAFTDSFVPSSLCYCWKFYHSTPSLIRFYYITGSSDKISNSIHRFKCLYCDFECGSSRELLEAHWSSKDCSFALATCAQFEPQRAKRYRRAYEQRDKKKQIFNILNGLGRCSGYCCLPLYGFSVMIAFLFGLYAIMIAYPIRLLATPFFFLFYLVLIETLIIQQIQSFDFADLFVAIIMPTVDLRFINISVPLMITITFSMSLGLSRFTTMCFKGIAHISKTSRKSLKKIASQRHILKEGEGGKKSAKSAGKEAAKEVAKEQATDKLIEEADKTLVKAKTYKNQQRMDSADSVDSVEPIKRSVSKRKRTLRPSTSQFMI